MPSIPFGYDKIGNLTSYNDGTGVVTYGYDQANRMTTLTEPDGALSKYSYDNANRKTKIQYPNGTGMKIGYDSMGHETSNIGGTMDGSGNIQTTYDNFAYSYMDGSTQRSVLQSATVSVDPLNQNTGNAWAYSYPRDVQRDKLKQREKKQSTVVPALSKS